MSIVSVFAVMFLVMLLGMVMNVGRQVDGKIRMQNAADAAAYSGGVVLARGMNTLAFTNHLLCDVFAVTAFCAKPATRTRPPTSPASWPPGTRWAGVPAVRLSQVPRPWARPSGRRPRWSSRWSTTIGLGQGGERRRSCR